MGQAVTYPIGKIRCAQLRGDGAAERRKWEDPSASHFVLRSG